MEGIEWGIKMKNVFYWKVFLGIWTIICTILCTSNYILDSEPLSIMKWIMSIMFCGFWLMAILKKIVNKWISIVYWCAIWVAIILLSIYVFVYNDISEIFDIISYICILLIGPLGGISVSIDIIDYSIVFIISTIFLCLQLMPIRKEKM